MRDAGQQSISTPRTTAVDHADDAAEPSTALVPGWFFDQRYVLVESLGAGGMGEVWRAYDIKLERPVALKFTRGRARDPTAERRIVREARAMAQLSHANVLPVHDVVTADGMVCIVMEFEPGDTLQAWLRAQARPVREIAAHFAAAARGLYAAHVAGFVHRDFKPTNVLVGTDPQGDRVRVMDFGLALIGAPEPSDLAVGGLHLSAPAETLTQPGLVLGTPAYMAPEQRRGEVVDARGDQYSFCVSLYEALLGERPSRGNRSETGIAADPLATADPRRCPAALRRLLRRGLAVDPADRFASMAPIIAALDAEAIGHPRQRAAIGAAIVLAVGGAGWAGVTNLAESAERSACARESASITEIWNPSLATQLEASLLGTGIDYAADTHARVVERLDAYATAWSTLRGEACVAARVDERANAAPWDAQVTCFDDGRDAVQSLVGLLAEAGPEVLPAAIDEVARLPRLALCSDAAWLAQQPTLPTDPEQRARVLALRREILDVSMRADAGLHDTVAARSEALVVDADALELPVPRAHARLVLANVEAARDDLEAARAAAEAAYMIAATAGADGMAAAAANRLVYVIGYSMDDRAESRLWGRLARMHLDRTGLAGDPAEPELATSLGLVAGLDRRIDDAVAFQERAVAEYRAIYSDGHPQVATSLSNLGTALVDAGRFDDAEVALSEAVQMREALFGARHPAVGWSLNDLAVLYRNRGQLDAGLAAARQSVDIMIAAHGPEHSDTAIAATTLGAALLASGDPRLALEHASRSLEVLRRTRGHDHRDTLVAASLVAAIHKAQGNLAEAGAVYRSNLAVREKKYGADDGELAVDLQNLGTIEAELGHYEDAAPLMERAIVAHSARLGPSHRDIASMLANLAFVLTELKRMPDAIEALERAQRILDGTDAIPSELLRVLRMLGQARHGAGDLDGAIATLERAIAVGEAAPPDGTAVARIRFALAKALWDKGRERPRSLALAQDAGEAFAAAHEDARARTVTEWVAEHRRAPGTQ